MRPGNKILNEEIRCPTLLKYVVSGWKVNSESGAHSSRVLGHFEIQYMLIINTSGHAQVFMNEMSINYQAVPLGRCPEEAIS